VDQSIGVDETNTFQIKLIGIDETNTFQLKFVLQHKNCGHHRFSRFVGVRVGVEIFFSSHSIGMDEKNRYRFSRFVGVRVGVANWAVCGR